MDQEFNENHEVASSRTVYHVTVKFSQRSFTLSLKQHIRNACNALEFTFPTTKEFYDSVQEGEELDSKFKTASFIFGGMSDLERLPLSGNSFRKSQSWELERISSLMISDECRMDRGDALTLEESGADDGDCVMEGPTR